MTHPSFKRDAIAARVASGLRNIADFPRPGISFKDITPVLGDASLLRDVVAAMAAPWKSASISHVAGIESRGFILAAPVAIALGAGFVPIRKPGKLPYSVHSREYELEYGTDRLEIHTDACPSPSRVLLVDDVLATGGTARAAMGLIEQAGGTVAGCAFLIAIMALNGRMKLSDTQVEAIVKV